MNTAYEDLMRRPAAYAVMCCDAPDYDGPGREVSIHPTLGAAIHAIREAAQREDTLFYWEPRPRHAEQRGP